MKFLISLFVTTMALQAQAADYPILDTYKAKAQAIYDAASIGEGAEETRALQSSTRELVQLGVEVMKLYASKNPNCSAQFDVFLSEIPTMESRTTEELHDRYHDAIGLPAAPYHCIFGRALIVHPAMNWVRLKVVIGSERPQILADLAEVIKHSDGIRKNLDNPPN